MFKDYYEILEVNRNASQEVIEKAYITLAKKYHPDLNNFTQEYANEKMKEINEAYDILKNSNKRSSYNIIYDEWIINNIMNAKSGKETNGNNTDEMEQSNQTKAQSATSKTSTSSNKIVMAILLVVLAIMAAMYLPKEVAYMNAEQLMNKGSTIDAYTAFVNLGDYKDAAKIQNQLAERIYNAAIINYRKGDLTELLLAKNGFSAVKDYMNSGDYLNLISIKRGLIDSTICKKVIQNLDFEDTKELVNYSYYGSLTEYFLEGAWRTSNGGYYFNLTIFSDGSRHIDYNIPWIAGQYYKIEKGIVYNGSDSAGWNECYKITIINQNKINIYSFRNGITYTLYRQ